LVGPAVAAVNLRIENGERMPAGSTWSQVGSIPTRFIGVTAEEPEQLSPLFVAAVRNNAGPLESKGQQPSACNLSGECRRNYMTS
jgi:hypothetical protein